LNLYFSSDKDRQEETRKSSDEKQDSSKDKKREETRDWSNISNIKELKKM